MYQQFFHSRFKGIVLINLMSLASNNLTIAQWIQDTDIKGGTITCIVSESSRLYIGLAGGGIYSSADNGSSWTRKNNGLSDYSVSAMLAKDEYIFAGFISFGIFVSTDQGETWESANNGFPNSSVHEITALDSFIFAAAGNYVYASTNNGKSWFWRSSGIQGSGVNSFAVKDSLILAGTGSGFFISSDYGEIWIKRNNGLSVTNINDLTVIDDKIFAAISGDRVYVSSDNGNTWSQAGNGLPVPNVMRITNVDSILFAAPFSSGIYIYTDYGNNWMPFNNGYNEGSLTNAFASSDNSLFAGNESGIYELKLGEDLWVERNEGIYGSNIEFVIIKDSKIYVGAPGGKIYLSSDDGSSWESLKVAETFASIIDIAFKGDTIFALTNGYTYYSIDKGLTWGQIDLFTYLLSSIDVKGNNIFVGTSGNDGIWLSTDGGLTWNQRNNGLLNTFVLDITHNNDKIYAGTAEGLYYSSDEGENWNKATYGIPSTFFTTKVKIIEEDIYACGIPGLYLSTNNGSSWLFRGFFSYPAYDITGSNNFIYTGNFQGIYRSSNKGSQWEEYSEGLINKDCISLGISDTTLFAGILGFGLWTRSLQPTGAESGEINLPEYFKLNQNYPNPFNPTTIISYRLPVSSKVTIMVYDILGRDIATLVNEEKQPGVYEVEFDASSAAGGLSGGIYFYRLHTENYSVTKKMIYLK